MTPYRPLRFLSVAFVLILASALGACDQGSVPTAPDQGESASETASSSAPVQAVSPGETIPNQYIVVFSEKAGEAGEAAQKLSKQFGVERVRHVYRHALRGFSGKMSDRAAQKLSKSPLVDYVEQDQKVQAIAQTIPAGIDRIQIDQNSTANIDGSDDAMDVDIAILDTGIDLDHPDLDVGSIRKVCVDESSADDGDGHGTHVAGTAGAIDNSEGVVGAAPGARVQPVKVLDSGGSGTISSVVCGIDFVTDNADQIEVANMSLGAQGTSETMRTSLQNSVDAGVYYAVAAGNDGSDVYGSDGTFGTSDDYIPAAYPEVASVSAMADFDGASGGNGGSEIFSGCGKVPDDTFADCFSNYSQSVVSSNPVSSPGAAIDVAAPGVSVLSTTNDGGTGTKTGTSMSSPHVAGSAALYIVENGLSPSSASDVNSIRQSLIDGGQSQSNWGPSDTKDPDSNLEPLVFWGSTSDTDDPPSVSWVNPNDGDTVSGTVTLEADATDDNSVSQVEFFVDGSSVGTDSEGSDGWTTDWNSENVSDGDHDLTAEATDDAGQTASSTITVTVDNTSDGGGNAPTVDQLSLSEDNKGGSPHADFDASWSVSDSDGDLDAVELTLTDLNDGETEDSATIDVSGSDASGTTDLRAKHEENSGHEYEVGLVVTDSNGNTASSTATEVEDGS